MAVEEGARRVLRPSLVAAMPAERGPDALELEAIEGDVVSKMRSIFDASWNSYWMEPITPPAPPVAPAVNDPASAFGESLATALRSRDAGMIEFNNRRLAEGLMEFAQYQIRLWFLEWKRERDRQQ